MKWPLTTELSAAFLYAGDYQHINKVQLAKDYQTIYHELKRGNFEDHLGLVIADLTQRKHLAKGFTFPKVTEQQVTYLNSMLNTPLGTSKGFCVFENGAIFNASGATLIATGGAHEATVEQDGKKYSAPRLVCDAFQLMNYNEIVGITFKDGNNRNHKLQNLIPFDCDHIPDSEVQLDMEEFFEAQRPHKLYVVIIQGELQTYAKIGITRNDVATRFKDVKLKVLKSVEFDMPNGFIARGMESLMLEKVLHKYRVQPLEYFKGRGECFQLDMYTKAVDYIMGIRKKAAFGQP